MCLVFAGTHEQLMQHLTRDTLKTVVLVVATGCAAMKHTRFKAGITPPWWPTDAVPFKEFSSRPKAELVCLLTALLEQGSSKKDWPLT